MLRSTSGWLADVADGVCNALQLSGAGCSPHDDTVVVMLMRCLHSRNACSLRALQISQETEVAPNERVYYRRFCID